VQLGLACNLQLPLLLLLAALLLLILEATPILILL
jgi:hypothetical protein